MSQEADHLGLAAANLKMMSHLEMAEMTGEQANDNFYPEGAELFFKRYEDYLPGIES